MARKTLRFRAKGPCVRIAWPKAKRRARSISPKKSPRPNGPTVRLSTFGHQPNAASADRNNQPDNRNNNNGFRVASTLPCRNSLGDTSRACQGAKSIAVPCRAEVRLTGESPFGQMKNRSGGSGRPKGSNAPPDFLFEGSYRWKTCGSPGQNGTFSHGRFICRQRFESTQNLCRHRPPFADLREHPGGDTPVFDDDAGDGC